MNQPTTDDLLMPGGKEAPTEYTAEQVLAGVDKYYKDFERTARIYDLFSNAYHGKGTLPIFKASLGDEVVEVDLCAPFSRLRDEDASVQIRTRMLQPLNNYYAVEVVKRLGKLYEFTGKAYYALSGKEDLRVLSESRYDDLLNVLREAYKKFKPLYDSFEKVAGALSGTGDVSLALSEEIGFSLAEIFDAAGVKERDQYMRACSSLMETKLKKLSEELVPCLETMASAAAQAYQIVQERSKVKQAPQQPQQQTPSQ